MKEESFFVTFFVLCQQTDLVLFCDEPYSLETKFNFAKK